MDFFIDIQPKCQGIITIIRAKLLFVAVFLFSRNTIGRLKQETPTPIAWEFPVFLAFFHTFCDPELLRGISVLLKPLSHCLNKVPSQKLGVTLAIILPLPFSLFQWFVHL